MKYLLFIIMAIPVMALAQLSDNFQDGNLTTNVIWFGDTTDYKVNTNQQLQLNATGENVSFITAENNCNDLTQWSLWVKLACSPSDNNQVKIYLASDSIDPTECSHAFYIKLGETGTSDAIELYYQDKDEHQLVARGKNGLLKEAFAVRIQVTRDDGYWQVSADTSGGFDYSLQCSGIAEYWEAFNWLSILCKYTASNASKYYFDDIYAGQRISDQTAPLIENCLFTSQSSLEIQFNESMQPSTLVQSSNYNVDCDFGQPEHCLYDASDTKKVLIVFPDNFIEGKEYNLEVKNLTDLAGNILIDTSINLKYYSENQFDILINEIMADPDPVAGLPPCEYLELFNRTGHSIILDNWFINIGSGKKEIPPINIESGGFHILCDEGCDTLLSGYSSCCTSLHGFSLPNSGCMLALYNADNKLIHSINYDENWYKDTKKAHGGWSLEQIDANNPCGESSNWEVSKNANGGTPGSLNSINANNEDKFAPEIVYASVINDTTVTIVFNEQLDSISVNNNASVSCDHGIGQPIRIDLNEPSYYSINLVFKEHFMQDSLYTIKLANILCDCAGNKWNDYQTVQCGISNSITGDELVINELLFNSNYSGQEFMEVYNKSTRVIDLSDIWIVTKNTITGEPVSSCKLVSNKRSLLPDGYLLISREPDFVKEQYFTSNPNSFHKLDCFPLLSNEGGIIALVTTNGQNIDELEYSEDMQFPLLEVTRGVSLERINPYASSDLKPNWHSAAKSAGYATPGYRNSQYLTFENANTAIEIIPDVFSPDNDGFDDILTINCSFNISGCLATIVIFDSFGRKMKLLSANNLCGEQAHFSWDGTDDNNNPVSKGIYIVCTEILNLSGQVHRFKNTVVVSGY